MGLDRSCLLYTSDAADERSSVDLGGRRIIKKKKQKDTRGVEQSTKDRIHTNVQIYVLKRTRRNRIHRTRATESA